MSMARNWQALRLTHLRISLVSLIALVLVVIGLTLGASVHKGYLILMAIGALGPSILRQLGLLNDQDEFQQQATAQAGLCAYLAGTIFTMAVVITGGWHQLSLSNDKVPASVVVAIMLVVYYASYCLSFWDTRKAVSRILLAFGFLWLAFSVGSAGGNLKTLFTVGMVPPAPFLLGAILCRWWPRTIGLALLSIGIWSVFFFHMLPLSNIDPQKVFNNFFMIALIPLPLSVAGIALIALRNEDTNDERLPEKDGNKEKQ